MGYESGKVSILASPIKVMIEFMGVLISCEMEPTI